MTPRLARVGLAAALLAAARPAAAQTGTIAPYLPIRWIDVTGHKWNRLLMQADRWNALIGTYIFQPAVGIGTEIYPHPSSFDAYGICDWVHYGVNACVNAHRDIHARDDWGDDRPRENALYVHELGHTIAYGKGHHGGRGVMAATDQGGTPTDCLTMDDYWYMCDYLDDQGWGAYCGVPDPEC